MFEILKMDGVVSRALNEQKLKLDLWNPRDFVLDAHNTIDDRPYGGGPGMVMMIEPLVDTLEEIQKSLAKANKGNSKVIYLSPKGQTLSHKKSLELSKEKNLILISGRYEGIDQRFIDQYVDEEISIGDFVLSGGEFAALTLIDVCARFIPGVIGNRKSVELDSFSAGLLKGPVFTRPEKYNNETVPEILLSGNHALIQEWKEEQSLLRTLERRPELLNNIKLTKKQKKLLED